MKYKCQSCGVVIDVATEELEKLYNTTPKIVHILPPCENCGISSFVPIESTVLTKQQHSGLLTIPMMGSQSSWLFVKLLIGIMAGVAIAQIPAIILFRLGANESVIVVIGIGTVISTIALTFRLFKRLEPPDIQKLLNDKDINGLIDAMGIVQKDVTTDKTNQTRVTLNWDVHNQAVNALTKLDKLAVDDLLAVLDDGEKVYIRLGACKVLGNIHAVQAVDRLTGLLEDIEPDIRTEAVRALEKIGNKQAVQEDGLPD